MEKLIFDKMVKFFIESKLIATIQSNNLDSSKQVQEVIFSRKLKKITHPPLFFNNIQVSQFHLRNTLV